MSDEQMQLTTGEAFDTWRKSGAYRGSLWNTWLAACAWQREHDAQIADGMWVLKWVNDTLVPNAFLVEANPIADAIRKGELE